MAVLGGIEADGTVNPPGAPAVILEEQLVEVHVLLDEAEVLAADLLRRQVDVHRLAREVLRVAHTVDALVDRRTAEATVHPDGPEHLAQRLAERLAEVEQGEQLQLVGRVLDTVFLRPL